MRLLAQISPFMEKCPLEGGVRCRKVSLYMLFSYLGNINM